ncbi:DUF7662 domain-containing protein [Labrys monachus]|uniref:DUF7662 domain-containing protein n=1 Tax=Labrys monachus TaxID=217067 RepID=A0ABU0FEK1_9HYPH|nr:hypothetical protein [Labrys monachus]MDQ0393042.1 hypothetical protein [Labrys monachus]
MSKYARLGDHLRQQKFAEVPMTFAEIERVTGVPLPPTALQHRAWWSNNPSNNVMTKVWLEAGFSSERVDLADRKLVFRRMAASPHSVPAGKPSPAARGSFPFGVLKGQVRVGDGVDLTEPADPEWGPRS